jgi:hypothetical protein
MRPWPLTFAVATIVLLASASTAAADYKLTGRVVRAHTNERLEGIVVEVRFQEGKKDPDKRTSTNKDGSYDFAISDGVSHLWISYLSKDKTEVDNRKGVPNNVPEKTLETIGLISSDPKQQMPGDIARLSRAAADYADLSGDTDTARKLLQTLKLRNPTAYSNEVEKDPRLLERLRNQKIVS